MSIASSGLTAEEAGINLAVALGGCRHQQPLPVESIVTGETLAALCTDCGRQLPAGWATPSSAPTTTELTAGVEL